MAKSGIRKVFVALAIIPTVGFVTYYSVLAVGGLFLKPAPKTAQELCIDDAMQSYSKRQTAEMALAVHFHRTDQDHLIKYINTREAVKAVYCSK